MARRIYNNAAGHTVAALGPADGAITFAIAPPFASLTGSDYIPLVLDPPQGPARSATFEIVYLTSYTAGSTSGVMSRGEEGTTGVSHAATAIWAQAPTLQDLFGLPPVGTIVPYAGSGDPFEANWVIADGRLISRVVYADFFARSGHAYNGGVDPGGSQVRIPDKRGVHSIGAINMGSSAGAGANDNAHIQAARGAVQGEVNHTLILAEAPAHSHGGATGTGATVAHSTENESPPHIHAQFGQDGSFGFAGGGISDTFLFPAGAQYNTGAAPHAHLVNPLTVPALSITSNGGGTAHNNVPPGQADSYIVRII